ncbi:MAG: hypothetical protein R3D59_13675 [Paracoccaceae bacterium]
MKPAPSPSIGSFSPPPSSPSGGAIVIGIATNTLNLAGKVGTELESGDAMIEHGVPS